MKEPRETLVLLPGMMCDARLFAPQIAAFEATHDIVVPDLHSETDIDAMAARILDQIAAPRFSLAGLSMGGIVAMAMAHQRPGRIGRLALLDTNHLADPPERRPVRDRQIADVEAGRLGEVMAEELKPAYLAEGNRKDAALLDILYSMALELGPEIFVSQSIALRDRPDQSGRLAQWHGPTLFLCGEEDALCTPQRHREMAGLVRGAHLSVIEGAGHISTLERPAAVNAALGAWLADG